MKWILAKNILTHKLLPNFRVVFYGDMYTLHFKNDVIDICSKFDIDNLFNSMLKYMNYYNNNELFITLFTHYTEMKKELNSMLLTINRNYCSRMYNEATIILKIQEKPIYIHHQNDNIILYIEYLQPQISIRNIFDKIHLKNHYDHDKVVEILKETNYDVYLDDIVEYLFPLGPKPAK